MSARKLVYRFMVFAPALFLAGIGVHARTMSHDFEFVENDAATERLILAYVPYLKKSVSFGSHKQGDLREARILAGEWILGAQRHDLKPLAPAVYEDTSSDGVKSQLFDVSGRITQTLLEGASRSALKGDLHQATNAAVLAINFSNILKCSDFLSLFNCANGQRQVLQIMKPHVAALKDDDREALVCAIASIQTKPGALEQMVRRSKQLFMNWRYKRGEEPLSIEDSQLLSDIPALARDGTLVAMRQMRDRVFASKDDHVQPYVSSLRVGLSAQDCLTKDARALESLLKTRRASR